MGLEWNSRSLLLQFASLVLRGVSSPCLVDSSDGDLTSNKINLLAQAKYLLLSWVEWFNLNLSVMLSRLKEKAAEGGKK